MNVMVAPAAREHYIDLQRERRSIVYGTFLT